MTLGGKGTPRSSEWFSIPSITSEWLPFQSCIRPRLCVPFCYHLSPASLILSFLTFFFLSLSPFLTLYALNLSFFPSNASGLMASHYIRHGKWYYCFRLWLTGLQLPNKNRLDLCANETIVSPTNHSEAAATLLHKKTLKCIEALLTSGYPHTCPLHIRYKLILQ